MMETLPNLSGSIISKKTHTAQYSLRYGVVDSLLILSTCYLRNPTSPSFPTLTPKARSGDTRTLSRTWSNAPIPGVDPRQQRRVREKDGKNTSRGGGALTFSPTERACRQGQGGCLSRRYHRRELTQVEGDKSFICHGGDIHTTATMTPSQASLV